MTDIQKQSLLTYLGYDTGGVDGLWGDRSRQATANFQRDFGGISVDGIAGEETEKALKHAVAYGIEKKPDSTDYTNVQNNNTYDSTNNNTGTFWDEIKYFTREEFRCPCGKCGGFPVEPDEAIVREMDRMREYFGKAVIVVPPDGHSGGSGVRCAAYNATLTGSAPNSTHLQGKAADFSIPGASAEAIKTYLAGRQGAGAIKYWYQITSSAFHANV